MPGLTPTGFTAPTLQEILEEIEAAQRASSAIGPQVDQSADSALGQLNGIMAEKIAQAWEALQAVYTGLDPDQNTGAVQDHVAAITGTARIPASAPRTEHTLDLDAATYAIGDLVIRPVGTTDNATNLEEVISPGGSVAGVIFEGAAAGLTAYTTATLYEIASPLTGFNTVSSPTAVTNGRNIESNTELRIRREVEAQGGSGSTSVDAVRAAILATAETGSGVLSADVLENVTGATDANGVQAYSIEAVVQGPTSPTSADDQALAEVIFAAKAGGVRASGTTSKVVTDSQGREHIVGFSRPAAVPVKSAWSIRVNAAIYNATTVKAAIAAFADNYAPGRELQWSEFICAGRAVGVTNVIAMTMARAWSPTLGTADLPMTIREYVTMDVANITLTVVP